MVDRVRQRLQDILDFNAELSDHLAGITEDIFRQDKSLRRLAERLIEISGEAATHVDESTAKQIEGSWKALRAMRVRLAHVYDRVSTEALWEAATVSLPRLAAAVQAWMDENPAN